MTIINREYFIKLIKFLYKLFVNDHNKIKINKFLEKQKINLIED